MAEHFIECVTDCPDCICLTCAKDKHDCCVSKKFHGCVCVSDPGAPRVYQSTNEMCPDYVWEEVESDG